MSQASSPVPRSALRRLLFGIGLAAALLACGAVGAAQWLMLRAIEAELDASVAHELAGLESLKEPRALALEVSARAARRQGFVYLLEDAEGACPLAASNALELCPVGNLPAWPHGAVRTAGALHLPASVAGGTPLVGRVAVVAGSHRLLVARDATALQGAGRAAWRAAALTGIGILAGALLVGWLAGRWLLGRLDRLNEACARIERGELAHRLPLAGADDEFDRLAGSVNRMLDRIVALLGVVRQVSEHAAHDLRTPLARLRLGLEGASRQTTDSAAQAALATALERVDALQNTFTALLAIADSEAGDRRDFVPVALAPLLAEVAEIWTPLAEEAEVTLRVTQAPDAPATMPGNPDLLRSLLGNLVHNAIKHAPAGSEVELGCAGGPTLWVRDHGPGIAPAFRERVFQKFFVGEPGSRRAGLGLGLSLVRVVAHRHGLAVTLDDAEPGLMVRLNSFSS